MLGFMADNEIQAGERPEVGVFVKHALDRAKKRLGTAPGLALVNLSGDDYLEALEASGLAVQKAHWILHHSVYLVVEE